MGKVDKHPFRKYCNSLGMRFKVTNSRGEKILSEEMGAEKAQKIKDLIHLRTEGETNDIAIYELIENYRESTALMSWQSDFYLEISKTLLKNILAESPKRVLELGCFNGAFLSYLAAEMKETEFVGIDVLSNLIELASQQFEFSNLRFHNLSYSGLKDSNDIGFDLVFTCLGYENIPSAHLDTYELQKDKDYLVKLEYFNERFAELENVTQDHCRFLMAIRIPEDCMIQPIIDAAHKNGWTWDIDAFSYIVAIDADGDKQDTPLMTFIKKKSVPVPLIKVIEKLRKKHKEDFALTTDCRYTYHSLQSKQELKSGKRLYNDGHTMHWTYGDSSKGVYCFCWATNGYASLSFHATPKDAMLEAVDITGDWSILE